MENFGEVIKRKRESKNWTQKQLADQLHVSPKSVSRWETNHGYPDIALLPELAKILELDYRELLDGNEYIAKKRDIQNKKFRLLVIGIISVAVIVGLLIVSLYKNKEPLSTRDILANEEWGSVLISNRNPEFYTLDNKQRDDILNYLHFDAWEQVPMNKEEVDKFIFSEPGISEWMMILSFDKLQIDIRYHEYQNESYISIVTNVNSEYELYKVSTALDNPRNCIISDMKKWYGFFNEHIINNQSKNIKELTIQESELLLLEYALDKENFLYHDYIFIEDQENDRYYFILISDKKDYKEIDVNIENGTIVVELTGEDKIYKNQYAHIFEVDEMYSEIVVKYNNEEISLLNAHHTSYSANKVK